MLHHDHAQLAELSSDRLLAHALELIQEAYEEANEAASFWEDQIDKDQARCQEARRNLDRNLDRIAALRSALAQLERVQL